MLRNKNAIVHGAGGSIGDAFVRTFANLTSEMFLPIYMTPTSTMNRYQGKPA